MPTENHVKCAGRQRRVGGVPLCELRVGMHWLGLLTCQSNHRCREIQPVYAIPGLGEKDGQSSLASRQSTPLGLHRIGIGGGAPFGQQPAQRFRAGECRRAADGWRGSRLPRCRCGPTNRSLRPQIRHSIRSSTTACPFPKSQWCSAMWPGSCGPIGQVVERASRGHCDTDR